MPFPDTAETQPVVMNGFQRDFNHDFFSLGMVRFGQVEVMQDNDYVTGR